jgi:SAM-dependent methyltransferase
MSKALQEKWNLRYQEQEINTARPARVLEENSYLLPQYGKALDLACGLGGNAQVLARLGLDVDAVDLSSVAIEKIQDYAKSHTLPINAFVRDVEKDGLPPEQYDAYDIIVVSYFLERSLFPQIISRLADGGLLFYQTWTKEKVDGNENGPSNPGFLLKPGELSRLCNDLRIVYYRENGLLGDTQKGIRNEAMLVGQKNPEFDSFTGT